MRTPAWLSIPCAWLLLATQADADPFRTPLDVRGRKLEGLTFSRLVVRVPNSEIGVEGEKLRISFIETLRNKGYPALGAESLVFDRDDSNDARYVLGGTVFELECRPAAGGARRCGISVQWELLDTREDTVSYRVVARHATTGSHPEPIANELVWGAFYSLLSRPKFVDALSERRTSAEAPKFVDAKFRGCPANLSPMPASADAVMRATVTVRSGNRLGSGAFISPDGLVLTAAHVVTPGVALELQHRDGAKLAARVIRLDADADVALLKVVPSAEHPCVALRDDAVNIGDDLFAIGSPLSHALSFSLTRGVVSGMREMSGVSLVQTDASINRGNSGGPLVDSQGRLVAVVSWKAAGEGVEGIAFGIPTAAALQRLGLTPTTDGTDPVLGQPAEPPHGPVAHAVDDMADPVIPLVPPAPIPAPVLRLPDKPRGPMTRTARTLAIAGGITAGVGVAGVATTYVLYQNGENSMRHDEFDRLRLANDASWLFVVAGAGLFLTAQVLPRAPTEGPTQQRKPEGRSTAGRGPSVFAGLGFGSVRLGVRY